MFADVLRPCEKIGMADAAVGDCLSEQRHCPIMPYYLVPSRHGWIVRRIDQKG
jgi:hypothetical protein